VLEEMSEASSGEVFSLRMKTFGVRKMKTVIENNSKHISSVWNFIIAHFISLCSCKFEEIRINAVDILSQTISGLLVVDAIPADQLLSIYFDIVKTKYNDVKTLVILNLKTFLTNHGYKIDERALIQIVRILKLTDSQGQLHLYSLHHR
jgi:hypothetical protein